MKKSTLHLHTRVRREMGSALLVALMVMVILSLLGIAFVTMSETESQISVNERDMVEALYGAEVSAKIMVEWFQNPDPKRGMVARQGNSDLFLPVSVDADPDRGRDLLTFNTIDGAQYKNGTIGSSRLFDKPYRGAKKDTLRGTEETPDVSISSASADLSDNAYLEQFSIDMFGKDSDNDGTPDELGDLRITDMRLYGPPIIDGNRYGIGTVKATASKFRDGNPIATRSVTVILNEVKFPAPSGPVEAQGAIGSGGNVKVHWGEIVSHGGNMTFPNGANSFQHGMPWLDYRNTAPFEGDQHYDAAGAPVVDTAPGALTVYELLNGGAGNPGHAFEDPWIRARSKESITDFCNPCPDDMVVVQPWMEAPTGATLSTKYSNAFVHDNTTRFPDIRYKIWKKAVQGRSRNLHYFKWIEDDMFKERGVGTAKSIRDWTNVLDPATDRPDWTKAGVFFFDTQNSKNPQAGDDNQGGILSPGNVWNGGSQLAAGFIYLNLEYFKIKTSSPWYTVPWPGETLNLFWKDLNAHRQRDVAGTMTDQFWVSGEWVSQGDVPPGGADALNVPADKIEEMDTLWAGSREWWFLDADDSYKTKGSTAAGEYDPLQDPSKPFVNFNYNADCCLGNNPPTGASIQEGAEGGPVSILECENCTDSQDWAWNPGQDIDGPGAKMDASIYGVLYNEGDWGDNGAGGGRIFGSIIVRGEFDSTGTTDIFFDERLIKDEWPPKEWDLPRVKAAAWKTE